jgi:hypothetical protein
MAARAAISMVPVMPMVAGVEEGERDYHGWPVNAFGMIVVTGRAIRNNGAPGEKRKQQANDGKTA